MPLFYLFCCVEDGVVHGYAAGPNSLRDQCFDRVRDGLAGEASKTPCRSVCRVGHDEAPHWHRADEGGGAESAFAKLFMDRRQRKHRHAMTAPDQSFERRIAVRLDLDVENDATFFRATF